MISIIDAAEQRLQSTIKLLDVSKNAVFIDRNQGSGHFRSVPGPGGILVSDQTRLMEENPYLGR